MMQKIFEFFFKLFHKKQNEDVKKLPKTYTLFVSLLAAKYADVLLSELIKNNFIISNTMFDKPIVSDGFAPLFSVILTDEDGRPLSEIYKIIFDMLYKNRILYYFLMVTQNGKMYFSGSNIIIKPESTLTTDKVEKIKKEDMN